MRWVPAFVSVLMVALAVPAWGQDLVPTERRGAPVEFALEETSGATRTISEARGRIIALFFEDRAHTEDNRELKLTLHRFIEDNHLSDQMRIYAVADVHDIPGLVREVARTAIRAIASEYHIQILLDWDGVMVSAPFSMTEGAANVALLDRTGRIAWRHAGAFGETETSEFFRALRRLLRET